MCEIKLLEDLTALIGIMCLCKRIAVCLLGKVSLSMLGQINKYFQQHSNQ